MILRELTNEEFNFFTKNNYTSVYQSANYALTMTKQGFDCFYYGIVDGTTIYGASLILIKKVHGFKYAFVPRGYIIDYNNLGLLKEFTQLLKKELSKKGVIGIRINPPIIKSIYKDKQLTMSSNYDNIFNNLKQIGYHHFGYNNYFEGLKPRYEAVIPLNKDTVSLFKNISKEFRTKIRTADSNGIKIFQGNDTNLEYLFLQTKNKYPRDLKYFQDIYYYFKNNNAVEFYYALLDTEDYIRSVQYRYQKQTSKCNEANANVFKNVNKNNTKVINQKLYEENKLNTIKEELVYATKLLKDFPKGIVLASILIIKNKQEIYTIMDGYDKDYKRLNAKHLLIWKLIEKFALQGYTTFNLGGITNYSLANNKFKGLNEFKLNYGATIYEYIGDLEYVINKPLHLIFGNKSSVMSVIKK